MDVSLFDYNLPQELIAQQPPEHRAASRMMGVDRAGACCSNRYFRDLAECIRPGDCLVLNDTRVIPARLVGRLPSGAEAELLLVRPLEGKRWEALGKPGRKLRVGTRLSLGDLLGATVTATLENGLREVELEYTGNLGDVLARVGVTPLPPYIKRHPAEDQPQEQADRERYQTVYARRDGAVAAPTAGLHFDEQMLQAVQEAGANLAYLTLHVGLGTFQPVKVERLEDHVMHGEWYELRPEMAQVINDAERVIAVGTTSVRTLETLATDDGKVAAGSGWSHLFIYPGFRFRVVDAMLTNFHLPRSTLLMLVSAFAGRELVLSAYEEAVRRQYRFYSYGDCMFIH